MSGATNIGTRRPLAVDAGDVKQQIEQGAESLLAMVSCWHLTQVRESHIVGAERSLVGLSVLLSQLRNFTPPSAA